MTEDEFRLSLQAEIPANLKLLAKLAENPKASTAIRRKATELLIEELERLLEAGNS